jgi:hypothetical protein
LLERDHEQSADHRVVVLAIILLGAFAGAKASDRLPKHHLTDETKSLVSVSTAVVATVSALVLGLLISNANTSFTRLGGQVTALSAEILRLDHIFAPPNFTSTVTLTLCALVVAGAVAMFVELEQSFGGLVRISPERSEPWRRTEQPKCTLATPLHFGHRAGWGAATS